LGAGAPAVACVRTKRSCLSCAYFVFDTAPGWKPGYEGDFFDRNDAIRLIRKTEHHVTGKCAFFPVWTDHLSNHWCAQFVYDDEEESLNTRVWGTWQDREYKHQTEELKKVREQLAASRKISASRLERLRRLEGKNGRERPDPGGPVHGEVEVDPAGAGDPSELPDGA